MAGVGNEHDMGIMTAEMGVYHASKWIGVADEMRSGAVPHDETEYGRYGSADAVV